MTDLENNTEIENEPREEIDADLAVEMVNSGFHVFIDKSDEQITYDMAFGHHLERFDFENHTFTAPMMEVAQYNATEALCEKFDSLNDDVRADIGRSLEDYANELFDNEESEFMWNNGLSEWENIGTSILSGETEYLRNFLNDVSVHYSSRTADLLEDLNDYTAAYLNRNKAEHIPQQDNTYAYKIGGSAPFTIVYLDIGSQERKTAVTDALNNIINNVYGKRTRYGEINPSSQPYRNLLEHVQNGEVFLHAFQGHLECLKYALENFDTNKELCTEMLESIRSAEKNPSPEIVIKGFSCRLVEEWEERGISYSIGQDGAFYRAVASDGTTFEYDFKPDREKVMSDHADKMAEAYIDHYEAEHGADGYAMFPDTEARIENIPQQYSINTSLFSAEHTVQSNTPQDYEGKLLILRPDVLNTESRTPENQLFWASGGFGCSPDKNGRKVMGQFLNDGEKTHFYREDFIGVIADKYIPEWAKKKLIPLNALKEKQAEHIPQQRDISHKTINAVPPARRGESRGNIMEQNTKFEVSSMSKLEGDGPAKAIGTLVVNGEFVVHNIRVVEGKNGLYVAMPSERQANGEYKDVVFPVTKDARAAIDNAVLDAYEKLTASPEKTLKNEIAAPEKSVSKVYAQMHAVESETSQTKAAGQMTIDDCLVVTGVKMNEDTNKEGQTKTFVAMPAKQNETGTYDEYAHAITADFHNTINKSVIASVNNIGRYEYKGVKFEELGENPAKSVLLHPKFADKLIAQLDKAGIPYQAKCAEKVTIAVKASDKQKFDTIKKDLTDKLNGKDKPQQKQEQTTGTHSQKK